MSGSVFSDKEKCNVVIVRSFKKSYIAEITIDNKRIKKSEPIRCSSCKGKLESLTIVISSKPKKDVNTPIRRCRMCGLNHMTIATYANHGYKECFNILNDDEYTQLLDQYSASKMSKKHKNENKLRYKGKFSLSESEHKYSHTSMEESFIKINLNNLRH